MSPFPLPPRYRHRITEAVTALLVLALGAFVVVTAGMGRANAAVPDESPGIHDTARLVGGQVTASGDVDVTFKLRCPRGDTWTASMSMLTVGSGAPDDIFSRTDRDNPPTGTCKGGTQRVTLHLITQPIDGVLYPAPRNCSAEYGVEFTGTGWFVAFDRGGADGGPDGPGPALCLR